MRSNDRLREMVDEWEGDIHCGYTLIDAIVALKAYDSGSTDSGVKDDKLRAWVRLRLLDEESSDQTRRLLAVHAREMISDEGIAAGRGIDDVRSLAEWIEDLCSQG